MPMRNQTLPIGSIVVDPEIQPRVKLDPNRIEDYRRVYAECREAEIPHPFPIIRVCKVGDKYYVTRGFRRVMAADQAEYGSIDCEIFDGNRHDAMFDARGDNWENGDGYTPEDREKIVRGYLTDPVWSQMSQNQIAEWARTSRKYVASIAAKIEQESSLRSSVEGKADKTPSTEQDATGTNSIEPPVPATESVNPEAPAKASSRRVTGKDGKSYPATKPGSKKKGGEDTPSWMDDIPEQLKIVLETLGSSKADMRRLSKFNMDDQREIVKLIDGHKYKTLGSAIDGFGHSPVEDDQQEDAPVQASKTPRYLDGMTKTIDQLRTGIDKIVRDSGSRPQPDYAQQALDALDQARIALAKWSKIAS